MDHSLALLDQLNNKKRQVKFLRLALAILGVGFVIAGVAFLAEREEKQYLARQRDRTAQDDKQRIRDDPALSGLNKTVTVDVNVQEIEGMAINIDKSLLKAKIENRFRKEGYEILDGAASLVCLVAVNTIKINDDQFAYSYTFKVGSFELVRPELPKYAHDFTMAVIFTESILGWAGIKATYMQSIEDAVANSSEKAIAALHKGVKFKDPSP